MLLKIAYMLFAASLTLAFLLCGCSDDSSSVPKAVDLKASVSASDNDGTVTVTNNDSFAYSHMVVHLDAQQGFSTDQGYILDAPDLSAGQSATYNMSDFAKSDGTRYQPANVKLQNVEVETEDGDGYMTGYADFTMSN